MTTRSTAVRLTAALALSTATALFVFVSAAPSVRLGSAIAHGLLVAVPMCVGIAVMHRREDRFARLLVWAGMFWSTFALTESSDEVVYSIGRICRWFLVASILYLLLTFPSGYLRDAASRLVMKCTLAVVGMLYVPTIFLAQQYPTPPPADVSCGAGCPDNAFALTHSTPAFLVDVVQPLREALTIFVFVAATVLTVRRARAAGPALRRALIPVAVVAGMLAASLTVFLVVRRTGAQATAVHVAGWTFFLSPLLLPVSFATGLLLRRLYATSALQREILKLGSHPEPADLRLALGRALDDPTLEIVRWQAGDPGRWIDESGWPTRRPLPSTARGVTEILADGRRVGALMHDAALSHDADVLQAAAGYAAISMETSAVVDQLRTSLDDLAAAQARMAAASDQSRRRIERDLHDGAQQRLVALRIKLGMEAARLEESDRHTANVLAALGDQAETAIDEIRAIAHGIYPSLLAERGLRDALATAALASPIPTTVSAKGIGRYTPDVESAVYFACMEAMQNAAKHAAGAQQLTVTLTEQDGALGFTVSDDGPGMDAAGYNGRLTGMRDRVRAVGGDVVVESPHDHGTSVVGRVPTA